MLKTFRYMIYLTKSQRSKLASTLELCRWVYNETLAARKNAYEQEGKSLTYNDTAKLLPGWREEDHNVAINILRLGLQSRSSPINWRE